MGNQGFKSTKRCNHLIKSRNFNKPGKAEQHTNDKYNNWGGTEKHYDYINREFGIKSKTKNNDFYLDKQNSNLDITQLSDEEIIDLKTQLYEDFYKKVPSDWVNFHDKTRWRVEKNRCKERRRDADAKMDIDNYIESDNELC